MFAQRSLDQTSLCVPAHRHAVESTCPGIAVAAAWCRRIVRRHGGSIGQEFAPGRVTTVFFSLIPANTIGFVADQAQDSGMPHPTESPTPPLQEAVLVWAAAVHTVEHEAVLIIRGGPVDRPRMAELLAAVETARLRCERLAAGLFPEVQEGAIQADRS